MKRLRTIVCISLAALALSAFAQASPVDGPWPNAVNNGTSGTLDLTVDQFGIVTGTAFGNPIGGFWDEATGKLVFYRPTDIKNPGQNANPSHLQVFTGYVFRYHVPGVLFGDTQVLAGTFEAFAGTGANKEKNVFGWFAQRPVQ